FRSRPGERVKDHDRHTRALRVNLGGDLTERVIDYVVADSAHVPEVALCIQIIHSDAGSGHDVVKMIEEQPLPGTLHLLLRIGFLLKLGKRRKFLSVQQSSFTAPDTALGFRLGSKDTAVILEVEFVIPYRYLHVRKLAF